MLFDPADLSPQACYQLLVGAVVPRPIAWISSISGDGIVNLAPFSFFTVASVAPPVLVVTQVNPRDRREKDTLRNLWATRECVVNVVTRALAADMNATCADYPPEVDEFAAVGIAAVPSTRVRPPGVAAAPVRFECTLREVQAISEVPSGGHLMLLDVVQIHVAGQVLENGQIRPELLDAVGKMGGDYFTTTQGLFAMPRPVLA